MDDIAVFFIQVGFCVETFYVIGTVTQRFQHAGSHPGHNKHIQNYIDGICQLDAVFCKFTADDTHGIGNHIHGSALHGASVQLFQLRVHFRRIHPVVDVAGLFLCGGADICASFYPRHVIDGGAVQITTGQFFLVQLDHFSGGASFCAECFRLLFCAVDPDDFIRLRHGSHLIDP